MITTKANRTSVNLIAPCGINCRLCRANGREPNPCPGCRARLAFQGKSVFQCSVHCERLARQEFKYCFECDEFPCKRLQHLDKRYRTRYATSPLENLGRIRADGIREFVRSENVKWACPECGSMLCMHHPLCASCGHRWHS